MAAVAFVLKGYPRLSETFIAQEILGLERRGLDVILVSLRHPTDAARHPVHADIRAPVLYLPEYLKDEPRRLLAGWRAARRLPGYKAARAQWLTDLRRDPSAGRVRRFGQACVLAAEAPDVVARLHFHFLHTPASVARYAATMRGLPLSGSAHAKDIWTTPDWELSEKLAAAEWVATCTASGAERLRALAPGADRVPLIYHGIDLSRFPPSPTMRAGDGPLTILSVGRLVEKKGYDDLIDALARLPADLDWRLVHIGGGGLKEALAARAQAAGIAARIEWRGAQPQDAVLEALRAADLFVLASRIAADGDRDGLPNVLMEAQSQALPTLATAVSAIPELILDGETGRLVPPQDPSALAAALEELLRDPDQRRRLGAAGAARIAERFEAGACLDALADRFGIGTTVDAATREGPMSAAPRVAFYAPMKPPEDPRPSGDRRMARALLAALAGAGYAVERPSAFKSLDMTGDPARQAELTAAADAEGARVAAALRPAPPALWLTYHCHYKAPDLIGPRVAAALGMPYVLIEASHAPKRLTGPWARFAQAAAEAIGAADLVLQPNPDDRAGVAPLLAAPARQLDLPPFADLSAFRSRHDDARRSDPARRLLATAAMMRTGAKQRSYAVLADALGRLPADAPDWRLAIAGDGPARRDVQALFAARPEATFLGALDEPDLAGLFAGADLFVWPAVGEAYGLALLEAQAAGLPAVVGDRPGVRAIAADGETALLVPEGDAQAFADAVGRLLADEERRRRMGAAAAARAAAHDLPAAAARLKTALETVMESAVEAASR